jgi:hypothetical protein
VDLAGATLSAIFQEFLHTGRAFITLNSNVKDSLLTQRLADDLHAIIQRQVHITPVSSVTIDGFLPSRRL